MSVYLRTNFGEATPSLKIPRVAFVAMRRLGILPMAFGKAKERCDALPGNIVDERTDRSGLFKPVALPQLTRPDALIRACLEIAAAGHRTTVDFVYDAIHVKEPHLIAPFFRLALGIVGIVVVDEVQVFEVCLEREAGGGYTHNCDGE